MNASSALRKATPVLVVEHIEPVLGFWNKLGVKAVTEVPGDGGLAFAILAAAGFEIMYQTAASVREDLIASASDPAAFRSGPQQATLYVEVDDIGAVVDSLRGERLVLPQRETFYGAIEVGYADPAGNIVVFAERRAERA
jgi:hypothetical protein